MDKKPESAPPSGGLRKAGVALVDDHPIVRHGLAHLIADQPDMQVCWEAEREAAAWQLIERCKPQVLIGELSLGSGSGIDLIKRIKHTFPTIAVLVYSMHDDEYYAERAIRAGACGYVMKHEPIEAVLMAVRSLLAGHIYLSNHFSPALLKRLIATGGDGAESSVERLSDRELQVFSMIGAGKGRREIADELHVSAKTVETYQAHIKRKLGLGDARKLVHRAVWWSLTENRG